jgi:uncharacterized protein YegP (UPF0339 family)
MPERRYPCYVIYKDKSGGFRWRYHARNGQIIAAASESYARKPACLRSIAIMKESAAVPLVEDASVAPKARGEKAPKPRGKAATPAKPAPKKPAAPRKRAPKPDAPPPA